MKIYCFTIRRTKAQANIEEVQKVLRTYLFLLEQIKKENITARIEYHFEVVRKSTGLNVHVHGVGAFSSGALFIRAPKGYSAKVEICRSPRVWNLYITKNPLTTDQILNEVKVSLALKSGPVIDAVNNTADQSVESEEYIEDTIPDIVIPKKKLFKNPILI